MTYFRVLACTCVLACLPSLNETAEAGGSSGGSSGGYASSGGSSGGGFFSRMRARHSGGSWGSSGGSVSHGSSGGSVSHGSSGGSHGGVVHVSHGSSGGGSHGSSGGRVGPLKRLVAKIHARKASHGSSGGSHGSSGGSHGSSGGHVVSHGSHGSHGSSGGHVSHGSHGGSTGVVSYSHPVAHSVSMGATSAYESPVIESSYQTYAPMGETIIEHGQSSVNEGTVIENAGPTVAAPTEGASNYQSTKPAVEDDAAMLTVSVPSSEAVVTVNGHATSSDGTTRQFMSRGLKDGFVYTYVVKVVYNVNGTEKTESKSIKLRPGDNQQVVFDAPAVVKTVEPQADPITVVRLHVPSDAQVTLAGNATNGSGLVRTFRTKQLKAGQQWAGYTIRVTKTVGGQAVSQERTVDVKAGSTTELTFEFDNTDIARN